MKEILEPPLVAGQDLGVLSGFPDYLRNGPKDFTADTIRTYRGQLTAYLRLCADAGPPQLAAVINRACLTTTLLKIPKERASTRRNMLFAVKAFARYMRDIDLLDEPACAAIIAFKVQTRHQPARPHLSKEQVEVVIKTILADRDLAEDERILNLTVFATLAFTGLRSSEACNLKLADVSFEAGTINVACGKGRKRRLVGLPNRLAPLLNLYLRHRQPSSHDHFFIGSAGNRLDRDLLSKRFRRLSRKVGFDVGAHRLRRTFATQVAHAGVPLDQLQLVMGHADIKTTRDYVQTEVPAVVSAMQGW